MTKDQILKLAEFDFDVDETSAYRIGRLYTFLSALAESNEILLDALNDIASWEEGNHVTSSFDNPGDAQLARGAICQCKTIMEKL